MIPRLNRETERPERPNRTAGANKTEVSSCFMLPCILDTSRRLSGIRFYTEYFNNARILSRLWPLPTCGGEAAERRAVARRVRARRYVLARVRRMSPRIGSYVRFFFTPSSHAPHRNRFCHNDNRTIQLPPGPTRQLRAPQRQTGPDAGGARTVRRDTTQTPCWPGPLFSAPRVKLCLFPSGSARTVSTWHLPDSPRYSCRAPPTTAP